MTFVIVAGGYLGFKTGWPGYQLPTGYLFFILHNNLPFSPLLWNFSIDRKFTLEYEVIYESSIIPRYFPFGADGMLAGASTVFFAYIGFDSVASTAEEVSCKFLSLRVCLI